MAIFYSYVSLLEGNEIGYQQASHANFLGIAVLIEFWQSLNEYTSIAQTTFGMSPSPARHHVAACPFCGMDVKFQTSYKLHHILHPKLFSKIILDYPRLS